MYKMRHFSPPLPSLTPGGYDIYSPRLRLAALPRGSLRVAGDFESLTLPILDAAARNAGKVLEVPEDHIIVPVHELQVSNMVDRFKEVRVYPEEFSVPTRAQQSIR